MEPPSKYYAPNAHNGRKVPNPGEALNLGGGRWLLDTGQVVTELPYLDCELTAETLNYWEERASKTGYTLNELIV